MKLKKISFLLFQVIIINLIIFRLFNYIVYISGELTPFYVNDASRELHKNNIKATYILTSNQSVLKFEEKPLWMGKF